MGSIYVNQLKFKLKSPCLLSSFCSQNAKKIQKVCKHTQKQPWQPITLKSIELYLANPQFALAFTWILVCYLIRLVPQTFLRLVQDRQGKCLDTALKSCQPNPPPPPQTSFWLPDNRNSQKKFLTSKSARVGAKVGHLEPPVKPDIM